MDRRSNAAALLLTCTMLVAAQTPPDQTNPQLTSVPTATQQIGLPVECCTIPALYPIRFAFVDTVNSQANKIGDRFAIRLLDPVEIDGHVVVPTGTLGTGEVVHADRSRFGGRPGELLLAVRYLDFNGIQIPLRSLTYSMPGSGKDNSNVAAAISIAGGATGGVISMFITGKEVNVPAGTVAFAKISTATTIATPLPAPSSK